MSDRGRGAPSRGRVQALRRLAGVRGRGVVGRAAVVVAVAVLLGACPDRSPPRGGDAGPRAFHCDPPLAIELVPSPHPPNTGIPMAGIAWTGDHCALEVDERHPDLLILIADLEGTIFGDAPVASPANRWRITSSSLTAGPAAYIAPVPRDTDVVVDLERDGERLSLTLRIEASTLWLLAAARVS